MTTKTYTPGPWHSEVRGTDAYVWGPDGKQRGCIARVNLYASTREDQAQRHGNVRLIEEAPTLVADLEAMVEIVEEALAAEQESSDYDEEWQERVEVAAARVEKARATLARIKRY